jgi:dTDP-4-dehydrorhamnose 3,5-epimerase
MHFQWPPNDHAKLVYCTHGEVLDVIVDLRTNSATYGHHETFSLNDQNRDMLYIPRGMAHGFCAMTDGATLVYLTTSVYNKDNDTGIRFDSFGFNWPVANPIYSERDSNFVTLDDLESPF